MSPRKPVKTIRKKSPTKRAIVLVSGGLDSAVTLYYALSEGYDVSCLSFDYGQRHRKELVCAKRLAELSKLKRHLIKIELPWKGSSLLDKKSILPRSINKRKDIPSTYVPSRNIIFLSFAASFAEAINAESVFIGANQIDYSGYPDCRLSFLRAFESAVNKGTKTGVRSRGIRILYPLINKNKKDIIDMGLKLGVPFEHTSSCYKGEGSPCGKCDSCVIRRRGFHSAGIPDPLIG